MPKIEYHWGAQISCSANKGDGTMSITASTGESTHYVCTFRDPDEFMKLMVRLAQCAKEAFGEEALEAAASRNPRMK